MPTLRRVRTSVFFDAFYWIGVAMAIACLAFVLAGNTEVLWRFEHVGIPVSWAFGAVALLAFVAAEVCPEPSIASDATEADVSPAHEWEAVEL